MPLKSSLALIVGAFFFMAIWGVGLASIDDGSAGAIVSADGYGVYVSSAADGNKS